MPTRRTPLNRARLEQIPDPAVEAFIRICQMQAAGLGDLWESEGGQRREMLDLSVKLHAALGLKPWDVSVFDVGEDGPAPSWESQESWHRAQALRRALVVAALRLQEAG